MLEIELQGARQIRAALPEAVAIFIAPPSLEALARAAARARRRRPRGRRAAAARSRATELAARDEFPVVVVNDDLERAVDELDADLPPVCWLT